MKNSFSKKQLALLIFTVIICGSNMFLKPALEALRSLNSVDESNIYHKGSGRIIIINYFMVLQYIIMFVILTMLIVMLVRLYMKSSAFLSHCEENSEGGLQGLDSDDDTLELRIIDKFEEANDLVWTTDALAISGIICMLSAFFCTVNDYFRGLKLWTVSPGTAGKYSTFLGWVIDVFAIPSVNMSDYAILWLLPMFQFIIIFGIITYRNFYNSKKVFCMIFPDIPNERALEPLIIIENRKKQTDDTPLFSQDYDSIGKGEKNLFLRQEDIDKEENNFFATENDVKKEPDYPEHIIVKDMGEEEEEELTPCPLCGSLNPESADKCCFCGGKMNK